MKRNLLIAFILAGVVTGVSGQDRIITLANDTIACKINKVTRSDIHFDVITGGVTTSGTIPLSNILSYSVSPAKAENPTLTVNSSKPREDRYKPAATGSFQRLRLGLNGGAGYILSSADKAEESMVAWGIPQDKAEAYYNNLKLGIYGSGDITFMVTPRIGAGLRYKFFYTDADVEGLFDPHDGLYLIYGTYSENIYVSFAGLSLFYTEPLGRSQKFSIYASYAAGMTFYRNEAETFQGNVLITGNALGMDGSLGVEYLISPSIAVGAELSAFNSLLKKVEMTDGTNTQTLELEKENFENLSRVELSLGIRFYLWNR